MAVAPSSKRAILMWLHRESVTLHAGVFLAVCAVMWLVLLSPQFRKVHHAKADLNQMKSYLTGTQEAIKRLRNLDAMLVERQSELSKLENRTLKTGEAAKLIEMFTQATEGLPILVLDIQPKNEAVPDDSDQAAAQPWTREGFSKKLLDVRLQCRYQTLGLLLEHLEDSDLAFGIEHMYVKQSNQAVAPNLEIQIMLAAFAEGS